jgi:Na+-driven multidrug efflux pump
MTRLLLFVLPALLVARTPGFEIRHIWYLSVASQLIQACFNLLLLRRELRKKLNFQGLEELVPGGATAT